MLNSSVARLLGPAPPRLLPPLLKQARKRLARQCPQAIFHHLLLLPFLDCLLDLLFFIPLLWTIGRFLPPNPESPHLSSAASSS